MILRLKRTPGIYLVGFMGTGKTSIGKLLAGKLGWKFVDLDNDIEARENQSISEIFEQRGEAEFRRIETECLQARVRAVECGNPMVVALGGGTFVQQANFELLENNGVTIWLDCPFEIVRRRVEQANHRPLARDPEQFAALFESRRAAYSRADYRVAIDCDDPEVAVEEIGRLPLF